MTENIPNGIGSVLLDNNGNKIRLSDYIIEGNEINKIFCHLKKLYHSNPLWLSIDELKTILLNKNNICNNILEEKHLNILLTKSLRPSFIEAYLNLACKLYPTLTYRACSSSDKEEDNKNTNNNHNDYSYRSNKNSSSNMIPSDYVTKIRQKLLEYRTQHISNNSVNNVDDFESSKIDDYNIIINNNNSNSNSVINSLNDLLQDSFNTFQVEKREARRLLERLESHVGTEYTEASVLQDSKLILDIRLTLEHAYNTHISSSSSSRNSNNNGHSHRNNKYELSPSTDSEHTIYTDVDDEADYSPQTHKEHREHVECIEYIGEKEDNRGTGTGTGNGNDTETKMGIMRHQDILPCLLLSECFGDLRVRRLCARALFIASDEYLRAASNDDDTSSNSKSNSEALMCAGVFCEIVKVADLREDAVVQAVLAIGRYVLAYGLPTVDDSQGGLVEGCEVDKGDMKEMKKDGGEEEVENDDRWSDDGFCTDSDGSLDDDDVNVDANANRYLEVKNKYEGEDEDREFSPFCELRHYQDSSPLSIADLRHKTAAVTTTASDNNIDFDASIGNAEQKEQEDEEYGKIDDSFDASGSLEISYVSYTDSLDTSSSSCSSLNTSSISISASQVPNRLPFSNHTQITGTGTTSTDNMSVQKEDEEHEGNETDNIEGMHEPDSDTSDTHIRAVPVPTPYPHPHHLSPEDDAALPTTTTTTTTVTTTTSSKPVLTQPKIDLVSVEPSPSVPSPSSSPSFHSPSPSKSESKEEIARKRAAQRVRTELRRRSLEETLQVAAQSQRRDRLKSVQLRASVIRVNTASSKSHPHRPLSASLGSGSDLAKAKAKFTSTKNRSVAFGTTSARSSPFSVSTDHYQRRDRDAGDGEERSFDSDISMPLSEQMERERHNLRENFFDRLTTPAATRRMNMNACVDKDTLDAEDARRRAADRVRDHKQQKERRAQLEAAANRMKDQKKWLDRDRRIAKFRLRMNSYCTEKVSSSSSKSGSRNNGNSHSQSHGMGIDVSRLKYAQPLVPVNDADLHHDDAGDGHDIPIDWTYMGPSVEALQAVGLAPLPSDDQHRADLWNSLHDALAQSASTTNTGGHMYTQDNNNKNQNVNKNNNNTNNMSNQMKDKVNVNAGDDLMMEADRVQSIIDRTLSPTNNNNNSNSNYSHHQFSRDSLLSNSLDRDDRDDSETDFDLLQTHTPSYSVTDGHDRADAKGEIEHVERERDADSVSSLGLSSFCREPISHSLAFPLHHNPVNNSSSDGHHRDVRAIEKESEVGVRHVCVRVGRAWGLSFSDHDHSSLCHAEVSLEPQTSSHDHNAPVLTEQTEYKYGAAPCFQSDLVFKLPISSVSDGDGSDDDEGDVNADTSIDYLVVVRLYSNSSSIQNERSSRYSINNSKSNKNKREPLGRAALPLSELLADSEHNAGGPALVLPLSPMDETGYPLRNAAAGAGFLELEARES